MITINSIGDSLLMKEIGKFIKSSGIYLVGNILSKLLVFILLPIYTSYIDPVSYGIYDYNLSIITFIYSVIFLDIFGSVLRYIFDYKNEIGKPITNGFLIFIISTIVYGLVIIAICLLSNILVYPFLLFLLGVFTILQQILGNIARGSGKNMAYVIGGIISTSGSLIVNIILIIFLHQGYYSIYLGTIIGLFLNCIYLCSKINILTLVRRDYFDKVLFKEMILYSLPFSINSAAYWFLNGVNRIVISNQLSFEDNGLYSVVLKFGSLVNLVTTGFQLAWQELSFSKGNEDKNYLESFYSKALKYYIRALFLGVVLMLPLLKIFFPIFIGEQYHAAENLIPLTLLTAILTSLSSFLASILSTLKKNRFIFTTTIFAAITNIAILFLLINPIGLQAANLSLCAGFFVNCVRRLQLIDKYLKIKHDFQEYFWLFLLFIIISIVFIFGSKVLNFLTFLVIVFLVLIYNKNIIINRLKKR